MAVAVAVLSTGYYIVYVQMIDKPRTMRSVFLHMPDIAQLLNNTICLQEEMKNLI